MKKYYKYKCYYCGSRYSTILQLRKCVNACKKRKMLKNSKQKQKIYK